MDPHCFFSFLWALIGFLCMAPINDFYVFLWIPVGFPYFSTAFYTFLCIPLDSRFPVDSSLNFMHFLALSQLSSESARFLWIPMDSYGFLRKSMHWQRPSRRRWSALENSRWPSSKWRRIFWANYYDLIRGHSELSPDYFRGDKAPMTPSSSSRLQVQVSDSKFKSCV